MTFAAVLCSLGKRQSINVLGYTMHDGKMFGLSEQQSKAEHMVGPLADDPTGSEKETVSNAFAQIKQIHQLAAALP
jgi:hypothetical protein